MEDRAGGRTEVNPISLSLASRSTADPAPLIGELCTRQERQQADVGRYIVLLCVYHSI